MWRGELLLHLAAVFITLASCSAMFIFPENVIEADEPIGFANLKITDVTGYGGRDKRDVTNQLPEFIECEIVIDGDPVKLVLRRNRNLGEIRRLYVMRNGLVTSQAAIPIQDVEYYQDVKNGAAFGVTCQKAVASASCDFKLEGVLTKGNNSYMVYLGDLQGKTPGVEYPYKVVKLNQTMNFSGDYALPDDIDNGPSAPPRIIRSRRATGKTTYTVELLMVTDSSVYRFWYGKTLGSTDNERRSLTLARLKEFYSFILNAIDLRYKSIDEPDMAWNIVSSGLLVMEEPSESNWTDGIATANPNDADRRTVNSDLALESFTSWVKDRSDLPASDHVMLFTAYDLEREGSTSISGLAYTHAICSKQRTSVCELTFDFNGITVAAHELGHSLGAGHDGDENECKASDYFIMSPTSGPFSPTSPQNPWRFSSCSVDYFRSMIADLNTRSENCLLLETTSADPPSPEPLPGQIYDVDTQCIFLQGSGSYLCRGLYNESTYANICWKRYCSIVGSTLCNPRSAPRGTSCGDRKWCENGVCVFNSDAPSVLDNCPHGDQPGVLTSINNTCAEAIQADPSRCYRSYYNRRCCQSCNAIRTSVTGCEYGDRITGCDPRGCSTSESYRSTCCGTCQASTTTPPTKKTSSASPPATTSISSTTTRRVATITTAPTTKSTAATTTTAPTAKSTVPTTTAPTTKSTVPTTATTTKSPSTTSPRITPTTTKPNKAFNCPGNGFFADPENCRNYYLCFLGSMYSYTCDETKGFDEVVGDCTTSGCDVKTTTPPPNVRCTDFGEAHPDPSDCTRYYVCYYGIPYSVACGNLLAYNQATQRCERQNFESCLESMIAKEASTTSAVDTTMQDSVRTTQSTNAVDTTAGTTAAIEKTQGTKIDFETTEGTPDVTKVTQPPLRTTEETSMVQDTTTAYRQTTKETQVTLTTSNHKGEPKISTTDIQSEPQTTKVSQKTMNPQEITDKHQQTTATQLKHETTTEIIPTSTTLQTTEELAQTTTVTQLNQETTKQTQPATTLQHTDKVEQRTRETQAALTPQRTTDKFQQMTTASQINQQTTNEKQTSSTAQHTTNKIQQSTTETQLDHETAKEVLTSSTTEQNTKRLQESTTKSPVESQTRRDTPASSTAHKATEELAQSTTVNRESTDKTHMTPDVTMSRIVTVELDSTLKTERTSETIHTEAVTHSTTTANTPVTAQNTPEESQRTADYMSRQTSKATAKVSETPMATQTLDESTTTLSDNSTPIHEMKTTEETQQTSTPVDKEPATTRMPSTEAKTTTELTVPPVVCPRGLANITDVRDCRMYYTCLLGQEYHMTCPGGTGFNPTTQLCSVDGCLIDRDTPIPTERPHECAIQYGTEEDPVSCLMYVLCFMWTPKRLECDPNTAFNPQTGGCDEASYKPCIEAMTALVSDTTSTPVVTMTTPTVRSQTQGCPWTQPGMFSYVGDVQKYCRCGLGACTVYTCEGGLVFHADQKICGMP